MKRFITIIFTLSYLFLPVCVFADSLNKDFRHYFENKKWDELKNALDVKIEFDEVVISSVNARDARNFIYYDNINTLAFLSGGNRSYYYYTIELLDRSSKKIQAKDFFTGRRDVPPIISDNRLLTFRDGDKYCTEDIVYRSIKTKKTIKKIRNPNSIYCGSGGRQKYYLDDGVLYQVTYINNRGTPTIYWVTEFDTNRMSAASVNKGYYSNKYGRLTKSSKNRAEKKFSKSEQAIDFYSDRWVNKVSYKDIEIESSGCDISIKDAVSSMRFPFESCGKDMQLRLLTNSIIIARTKKTVFLIEPERLNKYFAEYKKRQKYADRIDKEAKQFVKNLNFNLIDRNVLRIFSDIFPGYLDNSDLENRLAKYYANIAENEYGIKIQNSTKETTKGTKYIPQVKNTYYTSEDQSYILNGQYIHKSRPKKETVTTGGYEKTVLGWDLIFAVDNESTDKANYVVEVEATWTSTEYHPEKERYCLKKGFIFCSDWGERYREKAKKMPKKFNQNYLIGSGGRVKHNLYLGEKKPHDLQIFISNARKVSDEHFEKYKHVMSKSGLKDLETAKDYVSALKSIKVFSPFIEILKNRLQEIAQHQKDVFNDENIGLASYEVELPRKYDKDFENNIILVVTTKDKPLKVKISTPSKTRELNVNRQVSGYQIFGKCLFCKYEGRLELSNIKDVQKEDINNQFKISYVYKIDLQK